MQHNPTKFLSGRIFNAMSVQNSSVGAVIWDLISTSAIISVPSTTTIISLAWQSSHTKGIRVVIPRLCHQFVGTYQCPLLFYTYLCILGAGWRHLLPPPQLPFKGVLRQLWALCPQPLHQKHLIPFCSCSLQLFWFLPWPLVSCWFLLSFLKPPNCWGVLVAVLYGSSTTTCSCTICSLRLTTLSFPSNWANLDWTPSWGQPFCSDSGLWSVVTSSGYITFISSYKWHMESHHCLWSQWKRQSL